MLVPGHQAAVMLRSPELTDGVQGRAFEGHVRGEDCRVPHQFLHILLTGGW